MDPIVLTHDLVPDESGLVTFQTPLAGIDADDTGMNCTTAAILWAPAVWEATMEEIIGITIYGCGVPGHPYMPLGSLVWPYGRTTDDPLEDAQFTQGGRLSDAQVASMVEDRRRLAALWLLSSQKNLTEPVVAHPPNRAVQRRMARLKNPLDPRVKIIQLRQRPSRDVGAPAPGTRTYRHRWVVDHYWRRPRGSEADAAKTEYVNGSLRGPAGAPFLAPAEPVKVWKR
jgi:hypothetical protein